MGEEVENDQEEVIQEETPATRASTSSLKSYLVSGVSSWMTSSWSFSTSSCFEDASEGLVERDLDPSTLTSPAADLPAFLVPAAPSRESVVTFIIFLPPPFDVSIFPPGFAFLVTALEPSLT